MSLPSKIKSLKNDILGKKYELSMAYVSRQKSREINRKYRKKDKATNVLSFALRKDEGELVLCKTVIKKEAKDFNRTFEEWLVFLVIHGMLHLKGMKHSSTMERAETFFCKKYKKKYDTKHNSRNRRRILYDKDRGGRVLKRRKKS